MCCNFIPISSSTLHTIQVPASVFVEYPIATDEIAYAGFTETVPITTFEESLTVTAKQSRIKDSITILLFRTVLSATTVTPEAGVNTPPILTVKLLFKQERRQ